MESLSHQLWTNITSYLYVDNTEFVYNFEEYWLSTAATNLLLYLLALSPCNEIRVEIRPMNVG